MIEYYVIHAQKWITRSTLKSTKKRSRKLKKNTKEDNRATHRPFLLHPLDVPQRLASHPGRVRPGRRPVSVLRLSKPNHAHDRSNLIRRPLWKNGERSVREKQDAARRETGETLQQKQRWTADQERQRRMNINTGGGRQQQRARSDVMAVQVARRLWREYERQLVQQQQQQSMDQASVKRGNKK